MTDFVILSTTTSSTEEAERIASALVEARLAACVQMVPQMRSVYRWQEQVESSEECLCLVKTRRTLVGQVEAEITRLHSYDCPEIVVLPIEAASEGYVRWLDAELKD